MITKKTVSPIVLQVDTKSALDLMTNLVFRGRNKHIDTRFHFIRECIERGDVVVRHVGTNEQRTDILKNSMGRVKFKSVIRLLGVEEIRISELQGRMYV